MAINALMDLIPYDDCDKVHPGLKPSEDTDGGNQPKDGSFDVNEYAETIYRSRLRAVTRKQ